MPSASGAPRCGQTPAIAKILPASLKMPMVKPLRVICLPLPAGISETRATVVKGISRSSQAVTAIVRIEVGRGNEIAPGELRCVQPGCRSVTLARCEVTYLPVPVVAAAESADHCRLPSDCQRASPPGTPGTKTSCHHNPRRPSRTRPASLGATISSRITSAFWSIGHFVQVGTSAFAPAGQIDVIDPGVALGDALAELLNRSVAEAELDDCGVPAAEMPPAGRIGVGQAPGGGQCAATHPCVGE